MTTESVPRDDRRPEEGQISSEAVARKQARIGLPVPYLAPPPFEHASTDSLRNYARGYGDVNPFYRDADYARSTRWGALTGQPTFMSYTGRSEETEFSEELRATGVGDPLAGVHAFYSGEELHWFRPIREGDTIRVRGGLGSLEVKESRMGGKSVHEVSDSVFWNQDGLLGVRKELLIRVERSKARSTGKYANLEVPKRYTPEEMQSVYDDYAREYIRGAEPRFWEDTEIGEKSVPLLKGPYTVTAYICFAEGTGPRNAFHHAHSDAYHYSQAHPRAFPPNEYGYADTVARVHWDREMAHRAGLPETYDYGGERVAWMGHAATNWMGDDAFLRSLKVRIEAFCFVGDLVHIGGEVVDKRIDRGDRVVDVKFTAMNQRAETIASAVATIILPTKQDPSAPTLPSTIPDDLSIFQ